MKSIIPAAALVAAILSGGCATVPSNAPSSGSDSRADPTATTLDSRAVFELSEQADRAYRESRWIDAVRDYQQLTEQVPHDAYAWFRLGNTFAQQGAYERAIHAFETSLTHDSEQPKPWFNLSTAYLLNAQSAMGRAHARLRPDDPARHLIEQRMDFLGELIHGRFEEGATTTGIR